MSAKALLKPSLDWLLVFVPIAIVLRVMDARHLKDIPPTWIFITACLAVVPLAGWMGRATEHLSEKLGEGVGGLLNATFGNAAELIIALMALQKGLVGVVKASITGSIIGNILLVLGISFFAGGLKFPVQKFNRTAARSSSTTLILAGIALIIPAVFHLTAANSNKWTPAVERQLSLAVAIVLFLTYIATLIFSLKTHKKLFAGNSTVQHAEKDDPIEDAHGVAAAAPKEAADAEHWSMGKSIGVLVVATLFVALMSEFLVGSIEAARTSLGLTETFVGVIVVAIIGNAAEHSTAVMMAMRNKPDLSLSIAVGSSTQIALFVAPVLIFASYLFGQHFDLEFTVPEIAAVVVSIAAVAQITGDGESNWLEGAQLMAVYAVLGILFYFLPDAHAAMSAATGQPAAAH